MGCINDGTLFREKRNLSFCTPVASAHDRQLQSFSVVIQTTTWTAFSWSNLLDISGDRECFGQTKISRARTTTDDESRRSAKIGD
jgi:hypothetical protein